MSITLLTDAGVDATGGQVTLPLKARPQQPDVVDRVAQVWGTFDSAVVHLEYSPDDGTTWISQGSVSAAGKIDAKLPFGAVVRGVTVGGGVAPPVLNMEID